MISTLNKIVICVMALVFFSCSKDQRNERSIAGVWKAVGGKFTKFSDNEVVKDSSFTFTGTMQLQNKSSEDNVAWFIGFTFPPFTIYKTCNWQTSSDKLYTINFYLIDPNSLTQFSAVYNVEKATKRTLIISSYNSDVHANLISKTTYEFQKQE